VLNRGSEPTFITQRQKQVTDITLGSPYISTQVGKRYVSDKPSHSDHRYICSEINKVDKPTSHVPESMKNQLGVI
jgi:hypothetical protein